MNAKSAVAATPVEQEELLEIARVVLAMLGEKDIRLKLIFDSFKIKVLRFQQVADAKQICGTTHFAL